MKTEKNESQVQPMKENSAKKNDLKFKYFMNININ